MKAFALGLLLLLPACAPGSDDTFRAHHAAYERAAQALRTAYQGELGASHRPSVTLSPAQVARLPEMTPLAGEPVDFITLNRRDDVAYYATGGNDFTKRQYVLLVSDQAPQALADLKPAHVVATYGRQCFLLERAIGLAN